MKSEALRLPLTDRLELAQALIKSFHPPAKPKVIDSEKPQSGEHSFRIEPDPVVTVSPVTGAPRRIAIPDSELYSERKVQPDVSVSIDQAFQQLRSALEAETKS